MTAALILIVLSGIHLDDQGLYYDEVHQAPASFRYLGKHPHQFTQEFNDILILNMSYSGALKSHIYGLYLRYLGHQFTVFSWRLLGILFVAAGICVFYVIAGNRLPWEAGVVFAVLLLSDATVILTSRYDWGPTALALGLRLVLLAVWISIERGEPTNRQRFAVGLIAGIAIFEKLVAIVLLGPLLLTLFARPKVDRRAVMATAAGGLTGILPLVYANYSSWKHGAGFISLSDVGPGVGQPHAIGAFVKYAYEYVALGHGEGVAAHVLGAHSRPFWPQAEAGLMLGALVILSVAALQHRQSNPLMRLAARMAIGYGLIGILLFLLPRETSVHHWIEGTPFQYAAIALALPALKDQRGSRRLLFAFVALLLLVRLPNVGYVEWALNHGRASKTFDRDFIRLGEFAAANAGDAVFIAADWGSATQIYCIGQGNADLVYEPYLSSEPERATSTILTGTKTPKLYVVTTGFAPRFDAAAKAVIATVAGSPQWKEVPVDPDMAALSVVQIRKFLRLQ
jgi:hypothetical protein